jgi:hypothetical protein
VDSVICGEAFDFVELVVKDSFVKISGHPNVEGAGKATQNIGAVATMSVNPGHGGSRGPSTWFFFASEEEQGARDDKVIRKSGGKDVTDVTGITFVA